MYQRLFMPVDLSSTCRHALAEALKVAHEQHSCLRLVHVVDMAQFAWSANEFMDVPRLQESLQQSGRQLLDDLAQEVRAAGIEVETHLLEIWGGNLAHALIADARDWQADLIVMGTHGYGGLTHMLLGSVAEGVVRQAPVPVLLVRNPA
ncbi:universal stress protein [Chitinilyticum piscinae]|uniref:Universal stress protein n=1 Tax=Chitinilyticum piscinae TaxID=2866724 RepID=A0A8J7FL62_9NEIS|nr:universal stress protein [Chitinilyticum piscinae]MBE9609837.1 universal stress protein [Chitinilyticum piscinae]